MTATLAKLAFAGMRSRLLSSALTILLSSAAAATIVLALEIGETARDPWQRTFDAANGAHVLATVPSQADARAIATLPGVAQRDEPIPNANARVASGGGTDRLQLAGLRSRARVNAPVRTEGSRPPVDGIVLERSFADALGLRVAPHSGSPARPVRSSCPSSARRSRPASHAIPAATPAWPGSRAGRSSASSRIVAAGTGPRRSGSRTPPLPRPSPRMPRHRFRPGPPP